MGLDGIVDGLHCLDDEIGHFEDLGLETVIRSHDSFLDTDAAVRDGVLESVKLGPVGSGISDVVIGIDAAIVLLRDGTNVLQKFVLIPINVDIFGKRVFVVDNKAKFFTHAHFPFQSV